MDQTQREQLESHLIELVEDYGPWAVLHAVTEALRKPFKELAESETGKRPRGKKGRDAGSKPPKEATKWRYRVTAIYGTGVRNLKVGDVLQYDRHMGEKKYEEIVSTKTFEHMGGFDIELIGEVGHDG